MYKIPKKGEYLELILRSPKTVFSNKEVALLWGEGNNKVIADRLKRYAKSGKLVRVHHGLYAKDKNYNRLELSTRIYTPSYVSFETVLTQAGVNFQFYTDVFVATYVTREIKVGEQNISFIKMKDSVLSNIKGIERVDGVAIATKERAFLDRVYVSKDYHFDNLSVLDWEKVFEILPIYRNKRMEKKVKEYFDYHKAN